MTPNNIALGSPHPALSKGKGSKKSEVQVLSFVEDLGEAGSQFESIDK